MCLFQNTVGKTLRRKSSADVPIPYLMVTSSSAKVSLPSSSKTQLHGSKHDATSRSRLIGASSSFSTSSRVHGNGGAPLGKKARVYFNGVDVTPQSLIVNRIKSTHLSGSTMKRNENQRKHSKSVSTSIGGTSILHSRLFLSRESLTSVENDSDSESSSSMSTSNALSTTISSQKEGKSRVKDHAIAAKAIVPSNQEEKDSHYISKPLQSAPIIAKEADSTQKEAMDHTEESIKLAPKSTSKLSTQRFSMKLSETPTEMLLELRSVCVALDAPDHTDVSTRKKRYLKICTHKKTSDKYVENRTQTLQLAQKTKDVMTALPATRDAACNATDWEIYDCGKLKDAERGESGLDEQIIVPETSNENEIQTEFPVLTTSSTSSGGNVEKQVEEIVRATLASPGCVLDVDGDIVEELRARKRHVSKPRRKVREKHGLSSNNSQKSRISGSQRSATSNTSVNVLEQSVSTISAGTVQDGTKMSGASSSTTTTRSQVDTTTSRSVLNRSSVANESSDPTKSNTIYANANTNVDLGEIIVNQRTVQVLRSKSLVAIANMIERAVQQNVYHDEHVKYRDLPQLQAVESDRTSELETLQDLWVFRCELTQNCTITCLAWNPVNDDLLAVSYLRNEALNPTEQRRASFADSSSIPSAPNPGVSPSEATENVRRNIRVQTDGLVLFWSLTNPDYPERIWQFPVRVTSIKFSTLHPNLLAVGFLDGVVSIYDTRQDDVVPSNVPVPIATSSGMTGKHLDAVWQVCWVARGGDESVVSVSGDGRVVEWSLKKGLSYTNLMTLKRASNPLLGGLETGASGGTPGVISRLASGRSLAFVSESDPSIYFVGTEDGLVHKCSVSYNEQYVQTYIGHSGPVYHLLVSPFCPDVLLSCSGDWSLKLWHHVESHGQAALTFHSMDQTRAILGASWSPTNAGVFATVAEDGRIEIWNLVQSTLDPVVRHFPKKSTELKPPETKTEDLEVNSQTFSPIEEPTKETLENTEAPLKVECTTVAFAPKAPVLLVGDSIGDVTVYRVPSHVSTARTVAVEAFEKILEMEKQREQLMRAIYPTKHV